MESTLKRTWAEINLDHLTHNFGVIRRAVGPETKLLGVIKADAYGHGAVRVAKHLEKLGAAYLAGLAVGFWKDTEELRQIWAVDRTFRPQIGAAEREARLRGWHRAVQRAFDWAKEE